MAKISPALRKKIDNYVNDIGTVCRLDRVVLFGSFAKGTQVKDSDIDIAVFSRDIDDSNRHEYMSLFLRYILKYKLDIQPVAFSLKDYETNSNDFIAEEIKNKGKLIFGKNIRHKRGF